MKQVAGIAKKLCKLLHVVFLLVLIFNLEDGSNMFFRNIG
jgi:hypothetical protein